MKNRKLFIVSFLVVATLIVGVGFAALNGDLVLNGNAAFYGSSFIQTQDLAQHLKVSVVSEGDRAVVSVHQNTLGYYHDIQLNVDILDTDAEAKTYEDHTVLAVSYENAENPNATLPAVTLSSLAASATIVGDEARGRLAFTATLKDEDGNELGENVVLMNGDVVYLHIDTVYTKPLIEGTDNPDNAAIADRNVNWTLLCTLHWSMASSDE